MNLTPISKAGSVLTHGGLPPPIRWDRTIAAPDHVSERNQKNSILADSVGSYLDPVVLLWLVGTDQGAGSAERSDRKHLGKFIFHFNRPKSRSHSNLFRRLRDEALAINRVLLSIPCSMIHCPGFEGHRVVVVSRVR